MTSKGNDHGLLSPFLPQQKDLIARQLSYGFGGRPRAYENQMQKLYSPMPNIDMSKLIGGFGNHNRGGNGQGMNRIFQGPSGQYILGPNNQLIPIIDHSVRQ